MKKLESPNEESDFLKADRAKQKRDAKRVYLICLIPPSNKHVEMEIANGAVSNQRRPAPHFDFLPSEHWTVMAGRKWPIAMGQDSSR